MMPRTQTSMRLKTDTLEKLKLLKKHKKLSMARVLALRIVTGKHFVSSNKR